MTKVTYLKSLKVEMTQLVIQFKFQINFVNICLKFGQNLLHKFLYQEINIIII